MFGTFPAEAFAESSWQLLGMCKGVQEVRVCVWMVLLICSVWCSERIGPEGFINLFGLGRGAEHLFGIVSFCPYGFINLFVFGYCPCVLVQMLRSGPVSCRNVRE